MFQIVPLSQLIRDTRYGMGHSSSECGETFVPTINVTAIYTTSLSSHMVVHCRTSNTLNKPHESSIE